MRSRRSSTWPVLFLFVLAAGAASAENILRRARPLEAAAPPGTADAAAAAAAAASAHQALQANPSNGAFRRAVQAIDSFRQSQAAARAAAQGAASSVPDGLRGLVIDPGAPTDTTRWNGASLPVEQAKPDGRIEVTVTQSQQKALLTWQKFDVGKQTDLHFDQTAGGSDVASWIALNRVLDPSLAPSRILGSIRAEGQVYVINRNGIIFGGSSQVNTSTLVLSSLDFGGGPIVGSVFGDPSHRPEDGPLGGQIRIDPGALLQVKNYGQLVLLGGQVSNGGTLEAPDGQVLIAAADSISFGASGANTLRGLTVTSLANRREVENTGVISTPRGNITMRGGCTGSAADCVGIGQYGLLTATTSAAANGSIALGGDGQAALSDDTRVELGKGSVTQVLPDDDGKKFIGYKQSDFARSTVRIEGRKVILEENASVYAPSGEVTLGTTVDAPTLPDESRVYLAPGATVDVSGLRGVQLSMESNTLTAQLRANELRDNPLLRDGPLRGRTVYFDARLGTTVADVSGYYDLVERDVTELMVTGGTVSMTANTIITREGSIIDLSGGSLSYRSGYVSSSVLLDPTGKKVRIENAVPGVAYVGIDGDFVVDHERWGVTETFVSSLSGTRKVYEPGYEQGASAGTLNLGKTDPLREPFPDNPNGQYTPRASGEFRVLDGSIVATTVVGPKQREISSAEPTGPTEAWRLRPSPASLNINQAADVKIVDQVELLPGSFGPDSPVDPARANVLLLPARWFDGTTFKSLSITHVPVTDTSPSGDPSYVPTFKNFSAGGHLTIDRGVTVTLADGGQFGFTGTGVEVDGSIVVPGGAISLTAGAPAAAGSTGPGLTLRLGPTGVLDVSGRLTNDALDGASEPLRPLNGGTVTLAASYLELQPGSLVDVSGGARLAASGSRLTPGNAGSISINVNLDVERPPGQVPEPHDQTLRLAGTLRGYALGAGGASGGSLSITTGLNVVIGAELPTGADPSSYLLRPDFFDQGGFSRFSIAAERGLTVTAGTIVQPSVESLVLPPALSEFPSGTRLVDLAVRHVLDPALQKPVTISLSTDTGRAFLDKTTPQPFSRGLTLENGVQIRTPVLSQISLTSVGTMFLGSGVQLSAPAGTISLRGSTAGSTGPGQFPLYRPDLKLGPDVLLDVSGAVQTTVVSGVARRNVLGGGSITLDTTASVLVSPTAVLDASGLQAVADVSAAPASGERYVPLTIDGNGGSISINAASGVLGGQLALGPGGPTGYGGTLALFFGGSSLVRTTVPDGFGPVNPTTSASLSSLVVPADRIDASGADSLILQVTPSGANAGNALLFDGSVSLAARRSIVVRASGIGLADGSAPGSTVVLSAPSLVLEGVTGGASTPAPALAGSSLTLDGQVIDVINRVVLGSQGAGFETATFRADGEIRLADSVGTFSAPSAGLFSSGKLVFDAAQVYVARLLNSPGSNAALAGVTIQSDQSIEIHGNGNPAPVPLSYGNTLTLRAPRIEQGGVLRAPGGRLVLEGTGADGKVDLLPGSITSASMEGATVPFNWADGQVLSGGVFLVYSVPGAAPIKEVRLDAPNVAVQNGAVVDVSGGGDLLGSSFLPGNGGSRNVLATPGAFAILPSRGSQPLPPGGAGTLLDPSIQLGDVVWLQGVPGLLDGYYTRLPAQYALLPGGMLIQPLGGAYATAPPTFTRPDGAFVTAGYSAVAGSSIRSGTYGLYAVMPQSVYSRYSTLETYSFNTYARELAASAGVVVRVPDDAGSAVLAASKGLVLQGTGRFGAGPDALLGNLDISAPRIALVGGGNSAPDATYLAIDVESLNNFGAGSVLLGGTRAASTDPAQPGTSLKVNATDVVVRTGTTAWSGSEILFAATDRVSVADGSILQTSGPVSRDTSNLLVSGDGAVLRLSTGERVGVVQASGAGGPTGAGTLEVGAVTLGAGGSLTLYGSRALTLSPDALLSGRQLDLASTRVNLGDAPAGTEGATLGADTIARLSSASDLLIRGTGSIHLYGGLELGGRNGNGQATLGGLALDSPLLQGEGATGGTARITAGTLTLLNSGGSATATSGSGVLTLDADSLVLGPGAVSLGGYSTLQARAGEVVIRGTGVLDVAGASAIQTSVVRAESGASYGLISSGALTLDRIAGSSGEPAGNGARLLLSGSSVSLDTSVVLPAGRLEVVSAGDLQVGPSAVLDLHGVEKSFEGQTRSVPAGTILLRAGGALTAASGASLDVSGSPGGGDAGNIVLVSGGVLAFDADARATVAGDGRRGGFSLDASAVSDLAALNRRLESAGFGGSRSYRLRQGDLTLGAGETVTAHEVLLQADSGSVTLGGSILGGGTADDPSGGRVRLAGGNGVTVAGGAIIDARAADPAAGDFVPASGQVELIALGGRVSLASGAVVDVRGGRTPGGGALLIRAPRTATDLQVDPIGGEVRASSVVLQGSQAYSATVVDAALAQQLLTEAGSWLQNASQIRARVAGGNAGLPEVLVAPAMDVSSTGDLSVQTALSLSGLASPGNLSLRAGGNLSIDGALSDGFDSAARTATLSSSRSFSYDLQAGQDIVVSAGALVRTGTGDIRLAAGRDILLADPTSVVYTAGIRTATAPGFAGAAGDFPTAGGDLDLIAGRDIRAAFPSQTTSAWLWRKGATQWNQNQQDATVVAQTSWSVMYQHFQQAVGALGGGDVRVNAGRDVVQLQISIPTTGQLTTPVGGVPSPGDLVVRGGGNLDLTAGRDVLGGLYVLGQGEAVIRAAGSIRASDQTVLLRPSQVGTSLTSARQVAPLLGLMDARATLLAGGQIEIEAAFDPMRQAQTLAQKPGGVGTAFIGYTDRTSLEAIAVSGGVTYQHDPWASVDLSASNAQPEYRVRLQGAGGNQLNTLFAEAPPTLRFASLESSATVRDRFGSTTSLTLSPSNLGTLEVMAGTDVVLSVGNITLADLGERYRRIGTVPLTTLDPTLTGLDSTVPTGQPFGSPSIHAADPEPLRLYALEGSVCAYQGGLCLPQGRSITPVSINPGKSVDVFAGRDVLSGAYNVIGLGPDPISRLRAGRDIVDVEVRATGPGTVLLEAGRDWIEHAYGDNVAGARGGFLIAVGNPTGISRLARDQATDFVVLTGTAGGVDYDGFSHIYLDPSNAAGVPRTYLPELKDYLKGLGITAGSDAELVARFDALPLPQQQVFLFRVYFEELRQTGIDYNDPESPRFQSYQRGFDAVTRLFPNSGKEGAPTGNAILDGKALETQANADISVLAPYGRISVGSELLPSSNAGGIVTRRGGDIRLMADRNIDLFTSRVFTLQGGDITMWTTNGSITAGAGSKTSVFSAPLRYTTSLDGVVTVDVFGLQTGAGIGVLDALPAGSGIDRKPSRLDLIAPRGEVNAGDAGIRVVGDLNIAAQVVVGVENIQVTGSAVGVPKVTAVNVAALTSASQLTQAATKEGVGPAAAPKTAVQDLPSIVTVEVVGYETTDKTPGGAEEKKKEKKGK